MLSDGANFVNLYEIIFPVRKHGDKGFLPLCAMSSSPGSAALGKSTCAGRELGGDPRDLYERVLAFLQAFFSTAGEVQRSADGGAPRRLAPADRLAFRPNRTTLVCQFW